MQWSVPVPSHHSQVYSSSSRHPPSTVTATPVSSDLLSSSQSSSRNPGAIGRQVSTQILHYASGSHIVHSIHESSRTVLEHDQPKPAVVAAANARLLQSRVVRRMNDRRMLGLYSAKRRAQALGCPHMSTLRSRCVNILNTFSFPDLVIDLRLPSNYV